MDKINSVLLSDQVAAHFELTTVSQLAVLIHKSPATIYCNISRGRLSSLPPIFRAPGSNKPLFVNVNQWIAGLIKYPTAPAPAQVKPKVGRPSHASRTSSGGAQ